MKNIILSIFIIGSLSLNAYQYKIENIEYDFTVVNEYCHEEDILTLKFDIEVESMIHLLEREIIFLQKNIDVLSNMPTASKEHSLIFTIEIEEYTNEIERIKKIKHRLEYYLTVVNGSLLS